MNPEWASVIVIGAVSIGGALLNYGAFGARIKRTEQDVTELKTSRSEQWGKINSLDREMGEVKTKVGLRRSASAGGD